jgi:TonB family protein
VPKRASQSGLPADTPAFQSASRDAAGNVIAVATNDAMLDLLRSALKDRHRLWRASDASQAAELLLAAPSSVLLIDVAVTGHDTGRIVESLSGQFPGLPILVTGRRDDEAALSALISSGAIFRFLHKPLSEDRARTFVEAGVRRLGEQPPPKPAAPAKPVAAASTPPPTAPAPTGPRASSPPPLRGLGRMAAIAGLLLVVVAAAALYLQAPRDAREEPPLPAAGATRTPAAAQARAQDLAQAAEIERLLGEAERALEEGRYAEPAGRNAIESFRAVLAKDTGNAAALDGLARTADLLLVETEFALLDGNPAAAASALDAARIANPQHPRLEQFSTQLAAERARLRAPSRPATAPPPAATAAAAAPQRTDRELQFERAIASAREAIAGSQTVQAASWIARASELGVDPAAVQQIQAQLDALRAATEREERARLLALANQRLAQGRLTEPAGDSAQHYLDLLRASDPGFDGVADTAALLGERLLAQAKRVAAEGRASEAEKLFAAAAGLASPEQLLEARAEAAPAAPRPSSVAGVQLESTLVRIAHAAPVYPQRAASRGIEGWVEVEFTVSADGRPRDARIVDADPRGVFDSSALAAIASWRYEPPPGGETRVGLRLRFRLGPG